MRSPRLYPLVAIGALFLSHCETRKPEPSASTSQAKSQASAVASAVAPVAAKPVLNDWFALGSGCRAKFDLPGDVTFEAVAPDLARPGVHRVRFHLKDLALDSATVPEDTSLKFARECAIRLNINPPAGMRLTSLAARGRVISSKGAGVELLLNGELKLGNVSLEHATATYPRGAAHAKKEEAYDFRSSGSTFPVLQCAEPKIIGFDATWIADRQARADVANVSFAGDKTLEIEARLEPCP